jgi:hypothetical protein
LTEIKNGARAPHTSKSPKMSVYAENLIKTSKGYFSGSKG